MPRMLVAACAVLLAAGVNTTGLGARSDGRGPATGTSMQACQVVPGALMRQTLKQLPPVTPGTVSRHVTVKVTAGTSDLPTLQNAARLIPMQKMAALK